mgnify:CR=1 FL=1
MKHALKGAFATPGDPSLKSDVKKSFSQLDNIQHGKSNIGAIKTRRNTSLAIGEVEAINLAKLRIDLLKKAGFGANVTLNNLIATVVENLSEKVDGNEEFPELKRGYHNITFPNYLKLSEDDRQELRDEHGGIRVKFSASLTGEALDKAEQARRRIFDQTGESPSLSDILRASIMHVDSAIQSEDLGGMHA